MVDRIARLYYWVVKNLVEELGEKRAEEELVEKIILITVKRQASWREKCRGAGSDPSMTNYKKRRPAWVGRVKF